MPYGWSAIARQPDAQLSGETPHGFRHRGLGVARVELYPHGRFLQGYSLEQPAHVAWQLWFGVFADKPSLHVPVVDLIHLTPCLLK